MSPRNGNKGRIYTMSNVKNVNENVNNVVNANAEANAVAMVTVGRNQYPADRVQHIAGTIIGVRRNLDWENIERPALIADPANEGKKYPKYKLAVTLQDADAWGWNRRAGAIELTRTIWLTEFDINHAFKCNEIMRIMFFEDVEMTYNFSVLLGCRVELTQVLVKKDELSLNPYGYESYTLTKHDDVANCIDDLKIAPYGDNSYGLDQKKIMLDYAESRLREGHDADDVKDHLSRSTCMVELNDKHLAMLHKGIEERATKIATVIPKEEMLSIMAYAKEMAEYGLDADDIIDTMTVVDIASMTDTQLNVIKNVVAKVVAKA